MFCQRNMCVTPDRLITLLLGFEGILLLSDRVKWFAASGHKGWTMLAALVLAAAFFVCFVAYFSVSMMSRRRFQFSIRFFLVAAIIVALVFGEMAIDMEAARGPENIAKAVAMSGGRVYYDCEVDVRGDEVDGQTCRQTWLRKLFGDSFFSDIVVAEVNNDANLDRVKSLPKLAKLIITPSCSDVTDKGLVHLSEMPQLRTLYVSSLAITDHGLVHLKSLRQLRELHLNCPFVTENGLEVLQHLPQLQDLSINPITDDGLTHLGMLRQVRVLTVGQHISDAGMVNICTMKHIEWLNLEHSQVTDAGLENIVRLRHLIGVDLGDTHVSNAGLRYLSQLNNLEWLSLDSTRVTDAGLDALKELKRMRDLYIRHTVVSDQGVRKLQEYLPNCRIVR